MDTIDFINSFAPPFSAVLEEIYENKGGPPAIPLETARLLAVLLTMKKPKNALEIGCSFGFSACLTASYVAKGGAVTTIERNAQVFETARANFAKAGVANKVNLIEGDALEILPRLCEQQARYDFIFMDAAKGQYVNFLPYCLEMLNAGGVLVADNIFHKGMVMADRATIPHRQRTIHDRMNEFLQLVSNHEQLQTAIVPIGDGLVVAVKL